MRRDKLEACYVKKLTTAAQHIYPDVRTISGCPTDPEILIQGRSTLLICSPNYLGLAAHPAVISAFQAATQRYGTGTVGSGVISGYTAAHQQVEEDLARYMNEDAAVFFNAVSDASAGVISAIVNPPLLPILEGVSADELGPCAVFVDSQNHASILDAVRLAKPDKTYIYRHCDIEHLEVLLRRSRHPRRLVITEGYFSMSARVAPLVEIADLCEAHDAMLFVDDAHGTGVFGATGRGTPEMLGVEDRVDFWVGSTAKGLGVRGGYIAGPRDLMNYLRISSRRYLFSGTLPAGIPAAVSQALRTAEAESWRRSRVQVSAELLREGLREIGCEVRGEGHIVPWFIGDDATVDYVSQVLEEEGVFASAVRFPAVAKGQAIVRFMLMATHTDEHIERTLRACAKALRVTGAKDNVVPAERPAWAAISSEDPLNSRGWPDRARKSACPFSIRKPPRPVDSRTVSVFLPFLPPASSNSASPAIARRETASHAATAVFLRRRLKVITIERLTKGYIPMTIRIRVGQGPVVRDRTLLPPRVFPSAELRNECTHERHKKPFDVISTDAA